MAGVLEGCETRTQCIERIAMRKLTIETSLEAHLKDCYQQEQSPLYSTLPKEIRDMIFEFAATQSEDFENKYKENAYYCRPGNTAPLRTHPVFLLACRRIWLEASALPMRAAEFTFWFGAERGPSKQLNYSFANKWTKLNRQNFRNLHFFTQKHHVDGMFQEGGAVDTMISGLGPKVLRMTMRHTDWFRWEDPLPLAFDDRWVQSVLNASHLASLEELRLELETLEQYKNQLQAIVDRLCKIEGRPRSTSSDPNILVKLTMKESPRLWHWKGPTKINDAEYDAHTGLSELNYRVVVLTWKAVPATMASSEEPSGGEHSPGEDNLLAALIRTRAMRGRRVVPPRLAMRDHSLRLQLLQGGWDGMQFPFAHFLTRRNAMGLAMTDEGERRRQFEKAFADLEATKMLEHWKAEGSLLRFE